MVNNSNSEGKVTLVPVGWKDAISFAMYIPLTIKQLESEKEVK